MGKEINLDDILAANLAQLKKDGAFSTALGLAKDAHLSPGAVGYILQTKPREKNSKGESGSCTLKSVASIAAALDAGWTDKSVYQWLGDRLRKG
jgi:hypothetical protein